MNSQLITALDLAPGLLAGALAYIRASRMPDISANNFFWIDLLRRAAGEGADVLLDGSGDELVRFAKSLM